MARRSDARVSYLGVAGFLIALSTLVWVTYEKRFQPTGFSPLQPVADMKADYAECKANAPEGFDCIMQPVLVSEGFIIAETGK